MLLMCNKLFLFFLLLHFLILDCILYYCGDKVNCVTDFSLLIYQTIIIVLLFSFFSKCVGLQYFMLFYP